MIKHNPTAIKILDEVAAEHGMSRQSLIYPGRWGDKVTAKRKAICRLREELALPLAHIAVYMDMHHTTVLHHLSKCDVPKRVECDKPKPMSLYRARVLIGAQARQIWDMTAQIEQQTRQIREMARQIELLAAGETK